MKISTRYVWSAMALAAAGTVIGFSIDAAPAADRRGDDLAPPRSPVQRPARRRAHRPDGVAGSAIPQYPGDVRPIDGYGNNPAAPEWGSAGIRLRRAVPAAYGDGAGTPSGANRPNARAVSNGMCFQDSVMGSLRGASDYLWQWGQFLDHDIDETPVTSPGEAFDILVPAGDPWFDPNNTGTQTIPLTRSAFDMVDGVREQLNNITAFIDASNVYGSSPARAAELRAMDGSGRLKTSEGNLLPFNVNGFDNAPTANDPSFFLAGDIRANEQVGLTAMHTLFVREHNYWADQIRADDPKLTGDEVYERARGIVAAEMQAVTFREFLPLLLGPDAIPPYAGYDVAVDPSITNVFATAAYRFGHTMLSGTLLRLDANLEESPAGHLSLAEAFFNPAEIQTNGIDDVLRGLAAQRAQEIDPFVRDEVRNFLFGPPGSGGLDLGSLNLQRGRDHGLPNYNAVRAAFGLAPRPHLSAITPQSIITERLLATYDDIEDLDPWIGLLAENPVDGGLVGETLRAVLSDQFRRIRDGDRFWYQSYLPADVIDLVEEQTFAVIIRRNTAVGDELPDNVFVVEPECIGDLDGNADIGFNDVITLLANWGPCPFACMADLDADGTVGFGDLVMMLAAWGPCR